MVYTQYRQTADTDNSSQSLHRPRSAGAHTSGNNF